MTSLTFSIEAVHHVLYDIQFILYRKVDKICINEDVVWWSQLCIVLKEESC
jgi:hypothetical protein